MAQQGRLHIGVDLNVNKSKLAEVQSALKSLQNLTSKDLINSKNAQQDLQGIITTAKKVEEALEKSFNPKLNSINLTQFKKELNGLNLKSIEQQFTKAGVAGQNAFRNLSVELMTTNKHIKESSALLDKMATTLANTVRWQVATNALNAMTGSVQKAYYFTKDLDASLNDIVIITGKSSDEMATFAKQANKAAKELRALTTDYTKASLIYYQQGLNDQDVAARSETTLKVANITKQSTDTVSEQLTAIWNGYKASAAQAEVYIDKVSAVAATTAADLEELATGMSKVASAANIMGVDIDQLNAQLATIVSVTRESSESIGTALKTVYARMSDIEAGLDTETTLGEYTAQMAKMGIEVLDANGKLRAQGEVVEEIGAKWKTMSREQQTALSQTIAGTRQYSRMMALFDNWGMYEQALKVSQNSLGTLQEQQDRYSESVSAHLKILSAESEELYSTLFNAEDITPMIDAITEVVGGVENLIEAIGGGGGLLRVLGSVGLNVFGDKITQSIGRTVRNVEGFIENRAQDKAYLQIEEQLKNTEFGKTEAAQELFEIKKKQFEVGKSITKEESEAVDEIIKGRIEAEKRKEELEEYKKTLSEILELKSDTDFNKALTDDKSANKEILKSQAGTIKSNVNTTNIGIDLETINALELQRREITKKRNASTRADNKYFAAVDEYVSSLDVSVDRVDAAFKSSGEAVEDAILAQEKYQEQAKETALSLNELAKSIKELGTNYKLLKEDQEEYNQISKKFESLLDKLENGAELTKTEFDELRNSIDSFVKISHRTADNYTNLSKKMDTFTESVTENNRELDKYKNKIKEFEKGFDLTKTIQQFVTWSGAIANVTTGINILHQLDDIWSNEDLTTGEKFAQTLTNVATAASLISAPVLQAYQSYKKFHLEQAKGLITDTSRVISQNKVTEEFKDQIAAIIANTEALDKNNQDTKESILLKIAQSEALDDTEKSFLQDAIAKNNSAIYEKNEAQGGWFKSKVKELGVPVKAAGKGLGNLGNKVFGATLNSSGVAGVGGAAIGAGVGALAIAGVAIAAVAGSIYAVVKAYNKQSDALKEANE